MGATTVVIPQIARPTFALSFGKTEISNVAESGISGPPAKPCRIRKATSSPRLCDSPHRTEHATKPITHITKSRTSPNPRASHPVRGLVSASAAAEHVMIHVPSVFVTPWAPAIVGMATLATVGDGKEIED